MTGKNEVIMMKVIHVMLSCGGGGGGGGGGGQTMLLGRAVD